MSSHLKEQAVYNTVCTQCKVFLLCMHRLRAVHDAGQRRADVCRAISVEDKVPDEGRVHAAVTLVASYGDFGGLGLNSLENHETTKPRNHETWPLLKDDIARAWTSDRIPPRGMLDFLGGYVEYKVPQHGSGTRAPAVFVPVPPAGGLPVQVVALSLCTTRLHDLTARAAPDLSGARPHTAPP